LERTAPKCLDLGCGFDYLPCLRSYPSQAQPLIEVNHLAYKKHIQGRPV
jgi:hypothetical protein